MLCVQARHTDALVLAHLADELSTQGVELPAQLVDRLNRAVQSEKRAT